MFEKSHLSRLVLAGLAALVLITSQCTAEVVVVGGSRGLGWESGGGSIPATVIRTARTVERTNAPGGVIDFAPQDRPNWIFPQRADITANIAVGANSEERGGSILSLNSSRRAEFAKMIDDDGTTALDMRQASPLLGVIIDLDLGSRFGINRFKFFPRNADPDYPAPDFPFQNNFIRGFELFVNDGTPQTQLEGVPIFETVVLETQNDNAVVDISIEPQYVRFIRLKSLTTVGFEIAEFQVFGTGFVPEARYVSNVFDFGDLALVGKLRSLEEKVGDTGRSKVEIRTRSGLDPQPIEFNKIRPGERLFRVGGGTGTDTGIISSVYRGGINTSEVEVPWKQAKDVEDEELKTLIETVLDNDAIDAREAFRVFKELPLEKQALIVIDQGDYGRLSNDDKGGIRDDLTNWSDWSPPQARAGVVASEEELEDTGLGVQVFSLVPRRYFQFSIDFFSDDFSASTGVGGLAFEVLSPPFAAELVAEIAPRAAVLGQRTDFMYAVRNRSRPGQDRGFDRFEIDTPVRVESIGRIAIEQVDGTVQEADFSTASLDALPLSQNGFSVLEVREDGFVIAFNPIVEDGTLLKVAFAGTVLRFGTTFTGRARHSQANSTIGQGVIAGNAADLSPLGFADIDQQPVGTPVARNLSVAGPLVGDLLINVRAKPAVFTPNEDDLNDRTFIQYDITSLRRLSPVVVRIFDLAGRLVRNLYQDQDLSGRFTRSWDGRDEQGNLVPPGHYVFSVSLTAGTGKVEEAGLVGVVY